MTKSSTKPKRVKSAPSSPEEPGALERYRQKRDPVQTNEPFAAEHIARPRMNGAFVVHLHAARRRHFDVRLQVGAVLQSFAVPKGPTLDPRERRLAVHTENHPLEYVDFEDVIPPGNYGAGAMIVWDVGRVQYLEPPEAGLVSGKLDFILHGFKLKGRFALVHTGDRDGRTPEERNQWLFFKKADAHSSTERDLVAEQPESVLGGMTVEQLPERGALEKSLVARATELGATGGDVDARKLVPMPCSTSSTRLDDPRFLYELKLDGVRLLADRRGEDVALVYRSQRVMTTSYPEVARAVRALAPERVLLDGEVVAFDEQGRPSFSLLGRRMHLTRPHDVAHAAAEVPVVYVVFDVLQIGDRDLRALPLEKRKQLLEAVVPKRGLVQALDHLVGDGRLIYELSGAMGLEGLVAKRRDSPYRPGPERSADWVKVKREREADFVVSGWAEGKGGRKRLGSLEVATFEDGKLVFRGRVGSGLGDATLGKLTELLRPLEVSEQTAAGDPVKGGGARHFVRPELVVNVAFAGWTEDGHLWHPVFRGIRDDVPVASCTVAPPADAPDVEPVRAGESLSHPSRGGTRRPAPKKRGFLGSPPHARTATRSDADPKTRTTEEPLSSRPLRAKITNRDKVFWPDEGYTKGELIDYYVAIAPTMLRFLRDRPIVLVRYPDGIRGKNFFQWNVPNGTPSWVHSVHLPDEDGAGKHAFVVDDVDGLAHVINLGCIPVHVLPYRSRSVTSCDYFVVDFDLGPRAFSDAITLALSLREILGEIGLSGFPKTSGQSGFHVLVPLGPSVSFDTGKMLVELVGRLLQGRHPDLSTMERRIASRGDRVFIDIGQTGRSRTIVAPYSVRAHPGATVSMPLLWEEVHRALDPREFTMWSAPARVRDRGDALDGFFRVRPDIAAVVGELGRKFGA